MGTAAARPELPATSSTAGRIALRPAEAARALGIGRTSLYRLIWSGKLRVARAGTAVLIAPSEIERFLSEQLTATETR